MRRDLLLVCTAVVGSVTMGFEMVAGRLLAPWFGGGLNTWAALIATVMVAMAIGYLAGGTIADNKPHPAAAGVTILAAATWLACLPAFADTTLQWILDNTGDGGPSALLAAAVLTLLPMGLLAAAPPVAIRILTTTAQESGKVAGAVYSASTAGSIVGVLGTAFALIPHIGSNSTTRLMAAVLAVAGIVLSIMPSSAPGDRV